MENDEPKMSIDKIQVTAKTGAVKSEITIQISDWCLYGYHCPYFPMSLQEKKETPIPISDWWWKNEKTGEKREYLGKDIRPEDCPVRA